MIRVPPPDDRLDPAERFAIEVLVDLSRLIPVEHPEIDAIRLAVTDDDPEGHDLLAHAGRRCAFEPVDGAVHVPRRLLRQICLIAGAAAEQECGERDRYQRVPSRLNPLVASARERVPVVSNAAVALREAVRRAAGDRTVRCVAPWPDGRRWAVAFTHDLDVVDKWPVFTGLRTIELMRKRELRLAGRVLAAAAASVGRNPVQSGVRQLLEREAERGVRSTWFVLCGTPTFASMKAGDLTYLPEGRAASIVDQVRAGGHEVGLHGSFGTLAHHGLFKEQRRRLEELTGKAVAGVRQHYVRIDPGKTQRGMVEAGFRYDATFGFPDRNGFRLGVADVVPAWDERRRETLEIDEVPLVWMDRALSKYQGIEDPSAWIKDGSELARTCEEVEGLWVGVWHPNLVSALGFPDALSAYDELMGTVLRRKPFIAGVERVAAWRRARRAVRVVGMTADGQVEVQVPTDVPFTIDIEDRDGRVVQRVAARGASNHL